MRHPLLTYLTFWFGLLCLAILNAAVRELVYGKAIGDLLEQQVSTVLMALLVFGFAWIVHRRLPLPRFADAVVVGVLWTMLTAGFEIFMIVVLARKPLTAAAAQYDLAAGNWWPFLLLAILFTPPVVWTLQSRQ